MSGPSIDLLFVDAHVVVANKPSGLLVHRGWDDDDDVAMFRVRDALGSHVYPVHRLDRGTSGALVLARSSEVAAVLHAAFEAHAVEKRYLALARGMPPDEGVIDHPVPRKESGERVPAVTRFRCVARSTVDRCSLVEAMPETGRLHQIRRHLRHANHPLIGDVNYGSGEINRHYRTTYGLHRLALHAHHVAFDHPMEPRARVSVHAPMPDDLGTVLTALGLPHGATVEDMGLFEKNDFGASELGVVLRRIAEGDDGGAPPDVFGFGVRERGTLEQLERLGLVRLTRGAGAMAWLVEKVAITEAGRAKVAEGQAKG